MGRAGPRIACYSARCLAAADRAANPNQGADSSRAQRGTTTAVNHHSSVTRPFAWPLRLPSSSTPLAVEKVMHLRVALVLDH